MPAGLPPELAALLPAGWASKSPRTRRAYVRAVREGFRSPYDRRVFLGSLRGETAAQAVGKRTAGRSAAELRALPVQRLQVEAPAAYRARTAALDALSRMRREGVSLDAAARQAGTSPGAVRAWVGEALVKRNGQWQARPADRLAARMNIASGGAVVEVTVVGSRQRSMVGRHWSAVWRYLDTGDETVLAPFAGKKVAGHELETDPDTLNAMALLGGPFDLGPDGLHIYSTNT